MARRVPQLITVNVQITVDPGTWMLVVNASKNEGVSVNEVLSRTVCDCDDLRNKADWSHSYGSDTGMDACDRKGGEGK